MTALSIDINRYKFNTTFHKDRVVHTGLIPNIRGGKKGKVATAVWREVKNIGSGGFGSVQLEKALVRGAERVRAVKRISRNVYDDKLFSREVQTLINLRDCPHLFVPFFGWYEDRDHYYLAMEYFELGDLGQYLNRDGPLPELYVQDITKQLLEALAIMHGRGICHRDIKPQNILIKSLTPIQLRLSDFGSSKFTIGTRLKTLHGTCGYRAPELLGFQDTSLSRGYTKAVDLWSLGCVIHQVLTTETPFRMSRFIEHPSSSISGVVSWGAETYTPSTDMGLLAKFCSGEVDLPTAILEISGVSSLGIDFIKKLLAANARSRMSAADGLEHGWLKEKTSKTQGLKIEPPKVFKEEYPLFFGPPPDSPSNLKSQVSAGHASNHELLSGKASKNQELNKNTRSFVRLVKIFLEPIYLRLRVLAADAPKQQLGRKSRHYKGGTIFLICTWAVRAPYGYSWDYATNYGVHGFDIKPSCPKLAFIGDQYGSPIFHSETSPPSASTAKPFRFPVYLFIFLSSITFLLLPLISYVSLNPVGNFLIPDTEFIIGLYILAHFILFKLLDFIAT